MLNYDELLNQQYKAGDDSRLYRKLWKAYDPDLEQIVLYLVPSVLIYIWLLVAMKKKEDSSETV